MGRAPCCEKVGLKKGPWTIEEDQKLTAYIKEHGHGSWRALPKKAGLLRCGKSCRLRWTNYLRPDIKRGEFSASEEQTIIHLHALLGNRWSAIAVHLPKRTDNEIKNYWNTHLKKRLMKMGLDPVTHKPQKPIIIASSNNQFEPSAKVPSGSSSVTHMAQWESVRLEAEARLITEAEMRAKGIWPPTSTSLSCPRPPQTPSMQSFGGLMMPTNHEEAGSCTAINVLGNSKVDSCAYSTSLKRSPSGLMMSLKEEMMGCPGNALMNSVELINSLRNWENSLQGQAGLMWPDSWKLYDNSLTSNNNGECLESSPCSSPSHGTNHGSPTSTLCSLDQLSTKNRLSCNLAHPPQVRKLSWSDNNILSIPNPPSSHNHSMRPSPSIQLCDGLQGAASKGLCGDSGLLGATNSLQELMQCEGLNDGSEESLLIDSNSSDFLGDLELVSENMSSTHQSASSDDGSGSGGDIRQISYSALLGEDYTEGEWNSVLKDDADEIPSSQDNIVESI